MPRPKQPRTPEEWDAWSACQEFPSCPSASAYRSGCRNAKCQQMNAKKTRDRKATAPPKPPKLPPEPLKDNVVQLSTKSAGESRTVVPQQNSEPVVGPIEQAVRETFGKRDPHGDFAIQREQAIALAVVLDDPAYKPVWHQYSSKLSALTACLDARKLKSRRGGKLAAVSAMARGPANGIAREAK